MLENFLGVLAPLVGKCFVATMSPGVTDTHCFKPLYDGKHIEDRHVVTEDGKAAYEGLSIYSATPDGLFLTYVNSTGGSGYGTAKVTGGSFAYQMTMRGEADAAANPYNGRWVIRAGGFEVDVPGQATRTYAPVQ